MRNSDFIKAVEIGADQLLKLVMYADDTTLLLTTRVELTEAEKLVNIFEAGSGAKVNAVKSELLPLVYAAQEALGSRFSLLPQDCQARLLGTMVGLQVRDDDLWGPIEANIKAVKECWSTKSLSLRSRVLIAKSRMLSQATNLLHVQDMPKQVARRIDWNIATFI